MAAAADSGFVGVSVTVSAPSAAAAEVLVAVALAAAAVRDCWSPTGALAAFAAGDAATAFAGLAAAGAFDGLAFVPLAAAVLPPAAFGEAVATGSFTGAAAFVAALAWWPAAFEACGTRASSFPSTCSDGFATAFRTVTAGFLADELAGVVGFVVVAIGVGVLLSRGRVPDDTAGGQHEPTTSGGIAERARG
jgi:hypothetical protein